LRHIDLRKASVARADTIRDINRQIILNYVRERGPISRAEISHQTALQRSTVSHIINELKILGLVEEFEGPSTGGRPPRLLRLRTKGPVAIGVDLGTQRTVVASSDLAGRVLDRESFTTNSDSDKTLKRIIDCCRKLMRKKDARIEGIGISLPGLVDHESGIVHFIPHFKWRSWPVAEKVRRATGVPVTVDNDANAASLAELWFGLPEIRDSRDFIMVLVEEGLGTGIVFDGQVYYGEAGAAGEFGHTTIGTGAPTTCAAGSRECWEAFASERAALARYKILKADSADQTSFDQLVKQALDGDQVASEALLETAHYIGVGIANLLAGLSPSTVIVGGIIARAWPLIADRLKKAVEENSICRGLPSARIVASTLGDNPQLMGALSLVLALKFSSNDIS
jgi:predicted NBD/HSP70 family sugar kinase